MGLTLFPVLILRQRKGERERAGERERERERERPREKNEDESEREAREGGKEGSAYSRPACLSQHAGRIVEVPLPPGLV